MTEELEQPVNEPAEGNPPPVEEPEIGETTPAEAPPLETFEEDTEAGPLEADPSTESSSEGDFPPDSPPDALDDDDVDIDPDVDEELALADMEEPVEETDGDADLDLVESEDIESDASVADDVDADGTDAAEAEADGVDADETETAEPMADETEADGSDGVVPEDAEDEDAEGSEPVETLGRGETLEAIHALLFASDRPLNAERLAQALGDIDRDVVVMLMGELRQHLEQMPVPYVLREIAGGYQLTTKAQFGPYIRRLFEIKKSNRLTKSVLETLAIIAYKQPVTRPSVEAIRGVSVSHAFDILQEKKLIKVSGVAEAAGRPKLYRTTDEFLMHFGIESLKELPSIEEIREMGY